jgi:hypothetical protein
LTRIPPPLHVADDGLSAFVHVDVFSSPDDPVAASNSLRSRSGIQNHSFGFEGIPTFKLQENRRRSPNFRQIQP